MISKQMIRNKLQEYEKRGLFGKNAAIRGISGNLIAKARHNLETAKIMLELSENKAAKDTLRISQSYVSYVRIPPFY